MKGEEFVESISRECKFSKNPGEYSRHVETSLISGVRVEQ